MSKMLLSFVGYSVKKYWFSDKYYEHVITKKKVLAKQQNENAVRYSDTDSNNFREQ